MRTHDGGVDEQALHVGVAPQDRGHTLPNAFIAPSGETYEGPVPISELDRQVTPWAPCAHDPQNRFNEASIVLGRAARITRFAR